MAPYLASSAYNVNIKAPACLGRPSPPSLLSAIHVDFLQVWIHSISVAFLGSHSMVLSLPLYWDSHCNLAFTLNRFSVFSPELYPSTQYLLPLVTMTSLSCVFQNQHHTNKAAKLCYLLRVEAGPPWPQAGPPWPQPGFIGLCVPALGNTLLSNCF